ncbi:hypothetical protein [Thermaurantiacus sp.]
MPTDPTLRPLTRETLAGDPAWLAHRYQPQGDMVGFRHVPRARRREVAFLTDSNLDGCGPLLGIKRESAGRGGGAPLHFILHSAFCCSTLLANALDVPGVATSLKEPVILNDLIGWRAQGADPARVAHVLETVLALLARPFEPGEAVIVKPSNVVTALVPAMLQLRPGARALLLHAPLPLFLASVARKGLEGRLWVRELAWKLRRDGLMDFGFGAEEEFRHTDLQVAALAWLAQHRLFARIAGHLGPARVKSLNSETLLARPAETMQALAAHLSLALDPEAARAIARGPAFTRHAKTGERFGAGARAARHEAAVEAHAEELRKVEAWAGAVASHAGVPMLLPAPLLA